MIRTAIITTILTLLLLTPFDSHAGPVAFESSDLPIIIIDTEGKVIWDEPDITAHMGIINNKDSINKINDPFTDYNGRISIEIRGQSSQMFPKKSYSFETQDGIGQNLNVPLLGMPPENDWVLYAPYSDKSLLRNVLTFELGRKLGFYSSRTTYCELIINGDYQGIYVLMEKIKQDERRVDIAKLYPGEITGDDLTGGYIFKVDKIDDNYREGYSGWKSMPEPSYPGAMDITYQYYDPKPDELAAEQRQYLKTVVNKAEEVLISNNFDDPETGYNKYLHTGSFIDFMIINEISKEVDKYRYSSFFYKKKDSKGGEIFAGPLWDFNLGYGNVDYWPEGLNTSGWLFDDVYTHEWSIIFWWKRLMEDPYFEDLLASRWYYLRQNDFSDANIHKLIDSLIIQTEKAKDRNYERWPVLGTYVWPNYDWQNNSYADEVAYLENWLSERLKWMDSNMGGSILNPAAELTPYESYELVNFPDIKHLKITLFDDFFEHSKLQPSDFSLNPDYPDISIANIYYQNPSELIMTIKSDANREINGDNLSLTIDEGILNGFRPLVTNNIYLDIESRQPVNVEVYSSGSSIFIRCGKPSSLGEQLEVYNTLGQLSHKYNLEKSAVNQIPANLPNGFYILKFNVDGLPYTKKIFISTNQ